MKKILITSISALFLISFISCKSPSSGVKAFDASSVTYNSISEFLPKDCAVTKNDYKLKTFLTITAKDEMEYLPLERWCVDPTDLRNVESNPQTPNIKIIKDGFVSYYGDLYNSGAKTYLKYLGYADWCSKSLTGYVPKSDGSSDAFRFCSDYIKDLHEKKRLTDDAEQFFYGQSEGWYLLRPIIHIVGGEAKEYPFYSGIVTEPLTEFNQDEIGESRNGVTQELILNFLQKKNGKFKAISKRYIFTTEKTEIR